MKKLHLSIVPLAAAVVLVLVLVSALAIAQKGDDTSALARKLVNQCANIHEGDIVLISGGTRDARLLEDLSLEVRKLGAFPLIALGSQRLDMGYYEVVPAKYDAQTSPLGLMLADHIAAAISIDYYDSQDVFAGVPAERIAAVSKAAVPINDQYMNRNIHQVFLGNNVYPTADRASIEGMTEKELADLFWNGIDVDYAALEQIAAKVKQSLATGKEIRITNANGTDLRFRIEGRPVFASDGIIGNDDAAAGGANCAVYLPAGEVMLAPVPGSAEGKIVINRQLHMGKEIRDLVMTFKNGELVSMTAKSGLEPFKAYYEASDKGRGEFSYIDLGINPNMILPAGSDLDAWMASGMVTVGMGNNYWSGGDNRSAFSSAHFLHGSTVEVDGKKIIDAGKLQI